MFINDKKYLEKAEIIFDKGTDRQNFLNGKTNKYSWVNFGSSYRLSDLLAAFLYGQIENYEKIQKKKSHLA